MLSSLHTSADRMNTASSGTVSSITGVTGLYFDFSGSFSCCGVPAVSVFSGFTILMLLVSVFIILLFIWLIFIQVINVHSSIQK